MSRTAILVTTCVIILGIYDLVVVATNGIDQSISRFLQETAFGSPLITFAFGFIAGHIFGYMKPSIANKNEATLSEAATSKSV
jgi:TRAP-type uncharacterized transport system fused permease subunit